MFKILCFFFISFNHWLDYCIVQSSWLTSRHFLINLFCDCNMLSECPCFIIMLPYCIDIFEMQWWCNCCTARIERCCCAMLMVADDLTRAILLTGLCWYCYPTLLRALWTSDVVVYVYDFCVFNTSNCNPWV